MSEAIFVREAKDYMKEHAQIARLEREKRMLGIENERLNEGLEAMRASNEILTRELEQAIRDRDAAEAANRRYRARNADAYERVLAERAAGRKGKRQTALAAAVVFLIGAVLTLAAISAFFWIAG